jgi:hypothetical protein
VVAEERREDRELRPAREQLAGAVTKEPANISPAEGNSAQTQVEQHRNGFGEVLPRGGIVTRPNRGMALYAGIAGARENERSPIRRSQQGPVVGSLGHRRAIEIMERSVRRAITPDLAGLIWLRYRLEVWVEVLTCLGQRLTRRVKERRLVHVVPNARQAQLLKCGLLLRPPVPHRGIEKIGKEGLARPDLANEIAASIARFHKGSASTATLEHSKLRVSLYPGIHDGNGFETVPRQSRKHLTQTRKAPAKSKDAVAIHVMNVQVQGITGDFPTAEFTGDLLQLLAVGITIA